MSHLGLVETTSDAINMFPTARAPRFFARTVALAVLVLVAPLSNTLSSQSTPPLRRLTTPDLTYRIGFTAVSGLRELRDGRVLVADSRERTLQLIDLRTGASKAVGREGAGPREWGLPTRLYALPGDSTLMSDMMNARYLLILPNGEPGPTFQIADGSPAAMASLVTVDARGRLIMQRARSGGADVDAGSSGIVDVLRYDRSTRRLDTIAQLTAPRGERSGAMTMSGGMLRTFTNLPFAASDQVVNSMSALSERVAIVRAAPYRVDWIDAGGRVQNGPTASASSVRITQAEKDAFEKSQMRSGAIVTRGPVVGAGAGSAAPTGGAVPRAPSGMGNEAMTWPATKPPFLANAALMARDGRVWVLRSRAHDDPLPTYDVFYASGVVVERVQLQARSRVVGFGNGAVYVARMDEDDLEQLEVYRGR